MKRRDFPERWGLPGLKLSLPFVEAELAKLAIRVLDQVIRPFTSEWHRASLAGAFQEAAGCATFRAELSALQAQLRNYPRSLAALAQVEDLTPMEAA